MIKFTECVDLVNQIFIVLRIKVNAALFNHFHDTWQARSLVKKESNLTSWTCLDYFTNAIKVFHVGLVQTDKIIFAYLNYLLTFLFILLVFT